MTKHIAPPITPAMYGNASSLTAWPPPFPTAADRRGERRSLALVGSWTSLPDKIIPVGNRRRAVSTRLGWKGGRITNASAVPPVCELMSRFQEVVHLLDRAFSRPDPLEFCGVHEVCDLRLKAFDLQLQVLMIGLVDEGVVFKVHGLAPFALLFLLHTDAFLTLRTT